MTSTLTFEVEASRVRVGEMSGEARPGAGSPVNHTGVEGATDLIIASKTATGEEESVASLSIMLLLLVLGFTMLLGSWLKSRGVTWLHQAGAALLLGMAGGLALVVQASKGNLTEDWLVRYGDYLVFDTEFFFLFLLPPIIFESGYALNGEAFFRNLGKIVYFAFPGTLLGAVTFGLGMYVLGLIRLSHPFRFANAMMFGSIIGECVCVNSIPSIPKYPITTQLITDLPITSLVGATDPVSVLAIFTDLGVEENLFAVVFGESVLNDAVAVVLYRAFSGMGETFSVRALARAMGTFMSTFLGSTAIGVGTGLASALFFKRFKLSEDGLHREHPSNAAVTPTNAAEVGSNDKLTMSSPNPKNTPGKQQVSADGKDKYTAVRSNERDDPEEAVKGAVLEASVVALFPWIAYMAAEAIQLVGIVSILFCGEFLFIFVWAIGLRRRVLFTGDRQCEESVLLVRTRDGESFGAFTTEHWRVSPRYYGTGESFVFQMLNSELDDETDGVRVFRWTKRNDYFVFGRNECVAVGGGRGFALWLDEELSRGNSSRSDTFGNEPLSSTHEFEVSCVELWTFE